MNRLGIMMLEPDLFHSFYTGMAEAGENHNIEVVLFSPLQIHPHTEWVQGYRYSNEIGSWEKDIFTIPEFIYDRTFYQDDFASKQAKAIAQWLKNRDDLCFLGYGLPNKWTIYQHLKKQDKVSPYLPETTLIESIPESIARIKKDKLVIIKPYDGAHGNAVYEIEADQKEMTIRTTKKLEMIEKKMDDDTLARWLEGVTRKKSFIMQRRLENTDDQNRPFDLRILLQKSEHEKWIVTCKGFRAGNQNSLLTNLSAGAAAIPYEEWKKNQKQYNWKYIESELSEILSTLPVILEEEFAPLFEIGLDIVIGKDSSVWILDMNSKPGHKMLQLLTHEEIKQIYSLPLRYCKALQRKMPAAGGEST
ncbi:YheC/YheD family protein [Bacillus salacetis]|uniref:YheC/YheD family protein n=1 Tax=Bacillus salacetis TaxID=2315464 RepID=A0A3A1QT94_9BACI|nr:YheC/YheD family protein [Bacillus salacetis]RIW30918.1 YheC/YheD family protein [Bacillus salacetis]